MIIDLNERDKIYSLGELIIDIGYSIKKYEENISNDNKKNSKLLKTKEVIEQYPMMTQYGLEQAVKENKIPIVKRGKLNFFDSNDIELYIKNQKKYSKNTSENSQTSKIKYI